MADPLTETPLRRAMRDADLSVREVAQAAGMSTTALHRRISGEVALNVTEIRVLSAVLGVSPADLLDAA